MPVLTAADLHAVKDIPGVINQLVFNKQRIRLADSEDKHVGAALPKLGVKFPSGLALAPQICACVYCFNHDAFRVATVRMTLNAKRTSPLQVSEKYVTGDLFGEPIIDARTQLPQEAVARRGQRRETGWPRALHECLRLISSSWSFMRLSRRRGPLITRQKFARVEITSA